MKDFRNLPVLGYEAPCLVYDRKRKIYGFSFTILCPVTPPRKRKRSLYGHLRLSIRESESDINYIAESGLFAKRERL